VSKKEDETRQIQDQLYGQLMADLVFQINVAFERYQSDHATPKEFYGLNKKLAVLAITNAVADIRRSADYHSKTGPSIYKIAGFVGKWVAHQRPIWTLEHRPINLHSADLEQINSDFAVYVAQALSGQQFYYQLAIDLAYCFEFRRSSGDDIALLLEHSLRWSPAVNARNK
jgi:hypothetical protein